MLNGYKNESSVTKRANASNLTVRPNGKKIANNADLKAWNKITKETFAISKFSSNRLLSVLHDTDLARLMPYFQTVKFSCGENVYQPNDNGQFIYFPETAVFSQLNVLEDGRTVETAMIGNEGMAGIAAILGSNKSFIAWTQSLIGGSALKINASVFKQDFLRHNALHKAFFEYLNNLMNQITQKAVCNQHHLIEERFCTWLLMIDDRCGKNNLILTHEQIAHFLGVHRPSVTCIAQNMRDRGIIKYSRGKIFICDRQILENSACECYNAIK